MSKENEFKILYWNIHYRSSETSSKPSLIDVNNASKIIKKVLDDKLTYSKINYGINNIDDINAVVFTESYPQIMDSGNCLNEFLNKHKFIIASNDSIGNNVTIAYKENMKRVCFNSNDIKSPEFLCLMNDNNIFLCGLRIANTKGCPSSEEQFSILKHEIENNTDCNIENIIMIGDFNDKTKHIKEFISCDFCDGDVYDVDNEEETLICRAPSTERKLCKSNPDKLFISKNFIKKKFIKVLTPEEIYCNKKYIDENDGHIKKEYLKKGEYNDKGVKYSQGREPIELDKTISEDLYKNDIERVCLSYGTNNSICNSPYPDHNLLFASIEIKIL